MLLFSQNSGWNLISLDHNLGCLAVTHQPVLLSWFLHLGVTDAKQRCHLAQWRRDPWIGSRRAGKRVSSPVTAQQSRIALKSASRDLSVPALPLIPRKATHPLWISVSSTVKWVQWPGSLIRWLLGPSRFRFLSGLLIVSCRDAIVLCTTIRTRTHLPLS